MKNILFISALTLLITSCNNSSNEADSKVATEQTDNITASNEHEHSTSESIELDHGAKWKVVPEMMQHIKNMETEVNQFYATPHSDIKEYSALAKNLQKNLDLLTSNCTMEGKAHDELHKWLHPHMELIESLSNAENSETAQTLILELQKSFETYHKYFQ